LDNEELQKRRERQDELHQLSIEAILELGEQGEKEYSFDDEKDKVPDQDQDQDAVLQLQLEIGDVEEDTSKVADQELQAELLGSKGLEMDTKESAARYIQ
jgi:hypothetical protein